MTAYSSATLQALAIAGGFTPGTQAQKAAAAALYLSGGDPAYTSGNRVGLWAVPVGQSGYSAAQLRQPALNAVAAHAMFVANGGSFDPNHSTNSGGLTTGDIVGGVLTGGVSTGLSQIPDQVANAIPGLKGIDAIAADFDKGATWLTTPSNWLHVAYVVGGGALILVGLVVLARPAINGAANTVTKVATGSTPVGRAAKAVGRVQKTRAAAAAAGQAKARRAAAGEQRRARTQARIEERHGWARAREQRAAERHAAKKTKQTKEEGQ
jgi:hypothetical protein